MCRSSAASKVLAERLNGNRTLWFARQPAILLRFRFKIAAKRSSLALELEQIYRDQRFFEHYCVVYTATIGRLLKTFQFSFYN